MKQARHPLWVLVLATSGVLVTPSDGRAQDLNHVAINAAALATIQPVDSSYISPGGPYLKQGLGGVGPGFSTGVNAVIAPVVLTVDYTLGWLRVEQEGRLVPGGRATGRLRDAMVSALAGVQIGTGTTRTQLLAGISHRSGSPVADGVPAVDAPPDVRRQSFTVGADVLRRVGESTDLLVTLRLHPGIDRSERARELGVGRGIYRAGIGLRFVLGKR